MASLRDRLLDPRIRNEALDDDGLLEAHEQVVKEKRLLHSAFLTFYACLTKVCDRYFPVEGHELELGSGAGFFKGCARSSLPRMCAKAPTSTGPSMRWQWILPLTEYGASMASISLYIFS